MLRTAGQNGNCVFLFAVQKLRYEAGRESNTPLCLSWGRKALRREHVGTCDSRTAGWEFAIRTHTARLQALRQMRRIISEMHKCPDRTPRVGHLLGSRSVRIRYILAADTTYICCRQDLMVCTPDLDIYPLRSTYPKSLPRKFLLVTSF